MRSPIFALTKASLGKRAKIKATTETTNENAKTSVSEKRDAVRGRAGFAMEIRCAVCQRRRQQPAQPEKVDPAFARTRSGWNPGSGRDARSSLPRHHVLSDHGRRISGSAS